MARILSISVPVPQDAGVVDTGTGAAAAVDQVSGPAAVQVSGTFVATFTLEESLDGVAWNTLGSAISTATVIQLTGYRRFLRTNVSVATSGLPVVTVAGVGITR